MPSYPTWDIFKLRPSELSLGLGSQSFSGGRNVLGIAQSVNYDAGGVWKITYGRIEIFHPAQHRAWIAASVRMNGGVMPMNILVPVGYVNPFPTTPQEFTEVDGTPIIVAEMGDGAGLYASSIFIRVITGATLEAGDLFSINHATVGWRLYSVMNVNNSTDSPTTDEDAILYSVDIRPPLREAVSQGDALEFDWPRCAMKLPDGESMVWSPAGWWRARPTVNFIEFPTP